MIRDFSLKKLETAARLLIPQLVLFFFLLIGLISWPVAGMSAIKPQLVLMVVYYWAIYRPTLVPPALCFCCGILIDMLSGAPIGTNAIILVALQWLVRDQRRFLMGQPYMTIWAVFCLVALAASLGQWSLSGLSLMRWPDIRPVLASAGVTTFLFPPVTMLLVSIHKILPVASRVYP
jgi:rod shape-determining protein MreD